MPALETPKATIGSPASAFRLRGVDGKTQTLYEMKGEKGTLVAFICNHCPYVQAQLDRLIRDARGLKAVGVNVVAINSNDAHDYPEDSFENMQKLAQEKRFPFPYLLDETQSVAKAYGAVCTPDFFGFNAELKLQYRGRLDEAPLKTDAEGDWERELYSAMREVASTGKTTKPQHPSIGCSIKWKQNA